jgi:hypothetical protein
MGAYPLSKINLEAYQKRIEAQFAGSRNKRAKQNIGDLF